jgi:hypothetical protein
MDRYYIDIAVHVVKSFAVKINNDMCDVGCRVSLDRMMEKMSFSSLKGSNSAASASSIAIGERLMDWDVPESVRVRKGSAKAKSIKNPLIVLTDDAIVICSAKKSLKNKNKYSGTPNESLRVKHVWRLVLLEANISADDTKGKTLIVTPGTAGMSGAVELSRPAAVAELLKNIENAKLSKHGEDTKFMDIITSWRDFEAESFSEASSRSSRSNDFPSRQDFSPLSSSTSSMPDMSFSESSRLSTSSASSMSTPFAPLCDSESITASELDSISCSEQSTLDQDSESPNHRLSFNEEISLRSGQMRAKRSVTFTTLRRSHPI